MVVLPGSRIYIGVFVPSSGEVVFFNQARVYNEHHTLILLDHFSETWGPRTLFMSFEFDKLN